MNGDEKVLREVLRSRAEDVDTVADFVGPSVGLARRRSRRAAAAGATAAVLVVSGVSVATWFAARPATPDAGSAPTVARPPGRARRRSTCPAAPSTWARAGWIRQLAPLAGGGALVATDPR